MVVCTQALAHVCLQSSCFRQSWLNNKLQSFQLNKQRILARLQKKRCPCTWQDEKPSRSTQNKKSRVPDLKCRIAGIQNKQCKTNQFSVQNHSSLVTFRSWSLARQTVLGPALVVWLDFCPPNNPERAVRLTIAACCICERCLPIPAWQQLRL